MEEPEKPKRGGWRGGGRPAKDITKKTYGIENDLLKKLADVKNASAFINQAIREKFEREDA